MPNVVGGAPLARVVSCKNRAMMPMLAHGESQILPALLGVWLFYPLAICVSIWTLVAGVKRERNAFTFSCAILSIIIGGSGVAGILKDLSAELLAGAAEWSEALGYLLGLLFWGFFVFSGVFALARMWRRKRANALQNAQDQ